MIGFMTSAQEERKMHPDYLRSRWWAAADNYLAMAHFCFERNPRDDYVWHMLFGWVECMEKLKEEKGLEL
jgi:hypothetical protein